MLKYPGMVNMDYTTISMLKQKAGQLGGFSVNFLLVLIKESSRLVPNFMFGVSQHFLSRMYGGPDTIPSNGIFSQSTDMDRLIIQCFMNLVVLTVIFLLWANNPIQEKVHKS